MKTRQFIEAFLGKVNPGKNHMANGYLINVGDLREFIEKIFWAEDSMMINVSPDYSHEDGALLFELDERSPNGLGN